MSDIDAPHVILVDAEDREIGTMEKLEAHKKGLLHRAFSIFLFNDQGEMLIHRRALSKYHCGGQWSNTCCSHPIKGKALNDCLSTKLHQEMGITAELEKAFEFTYRAEMENGLIEHEYDHVFIGRYKDTPRPNPREVCDWRYAPIDDVSAEMRSNPEKFTPWFRMLFDSVASHYATIDGARQQLQ
ncbi:MAG: isopentenyl-diphosphate Delta-isomerase [Cryomorphaceae bacterium]|nr:isopentenyl-diphosphate Delta-isomerase [Flavobacteriales bacterium]